MNEKRKTRLKYRWHDIFAMMVVTVGTCWGVWMILDLASQKLGG